MIRLHLSQLLPVLVIGLALMLPGCGWLADKPVTIASGIWVGYEPMFLARNEGWLDTKLVHLVETASATESLQALAALGCAALD